MKTANPLRVGVLFGGRSGEHEVSLNSARNVMDALREAGHIVIPMGITPAGRWLTAGDPMALLTDDTVSADTDIIGENGESAETWAGEISALTYRKGVA